MRVWEVSYSREYSRILNAELFGSALVRVSYSAMLLVYGVYLDIDSDYHAHVYLYVLVCCTISMCVSTGISSN